jgi:superfamily II DNA or RNA helicase
VPLFQELAEQELEAGNSIVLFMAFKATIEELCTRLKIKARIIGGQSRMERDSAIDSFQTDKERMLAANVDAGGVSVSLHDLRGQFPRVGLVSPVFSSIKMRQVFGRLPRAGGKSPARYRVVLAAGTCEEKIHKALSSKLDRIDLLNDGDLMAANLPLHRAEWPEGL